MSELMIFITIIAAAAATYATRVLPYLIFKDKKPSKTLLFLEKNIPAAIMVILIFYSLKDVNWSQTYGLHEITAIFTALFLYLKFKSVLLSIAVSTALYMFLFQSNLFF